MALDGLSGGELMNVADYLKAPAENYGNDDAVEMQWAMQAFRHAETYFNLITAVDPKILKLTPMDDVIYVAFRNSFNDLKVDVLDEDHLKSPKSKEVWREFCMAFERKVEDYNMGSLLRLKSDEDISETNTILVPRIQFLAIEIARNREGYNSGLKTKFKPTKEETAADS